MEEFRHIGDIGDYSISNMGRLRNDETNKILKPFVNKGGYFAYNFLEKPLKERGDFAFVLPIHRIVATAFLPNPDKKPIVDHIDNNRKNNSINNLRWVTSQENCMNRCSNYNSKTGVNGITYNPKKNTWMASITKNKIKYNLGKFGSKEEAIQARVNKSKELFGEFQSKQEKELVLNIKIPSNTKLTLNINIDEDYEKLEKEFELLINKN